MTGHRINRRDFGKAVGVATAGIALPAMLMRPAHAADTVREGLQIGAMGALRTTLPEANKKQDLVFDAKDFRDSTAVLLAIEQGELETGNTTTQHLIRAISENIPVKWVCGWGGGYNVLVSRKGLDLKPNDGASLKSLAASRKSSGKPLAIGTPTGSMQHAKLAVYLKSLGIDPDKDVQVVNIPFPNHPRALEAAEVDLAMTLSAFGAIAIEKGDAALFLHLFGGNFGKQEVGFIVTDKLIKEKPALLQRIVNAHVEAMKTFMGQPDKQIEFEKKYSRLPDPVIAMQEREFLKYNFRTNVADIKTMARELHELGWVKEDFSAKVESFVDLSFVAKASGLSPAELSTW
ncbi:ABC transporter substrate-binding protein [Rhodoplanes sp. Z2-YC6860]|uniref:ABC transporter substrate-binding protein n=1 Tax=Rhodoplanes sp. Z2-YC6860 TaxID=674703 RepID=UPI00078EC96F|nr:ABC transporter substrate-binding protein [Rhodoplanes sp. Z2-YC6860]AMN43167.1 ABC transporter substrate-binding protein [Rhodoplanes sp. Z2-YC6860]